MLQALLLLLWGDILAQRPLEILGECFVGVLCRRVPSALLAEVLKLFTCFVRDLIIDQKFMEFILQILTYFYEKELKELTVVYKHYNKGF